MRERVCVLCVVWVRVCECGYVGVSKVPMGENSSVDNGQRPKTDGYALRWCARVRAYVKGAEADAVLALQVPGAHVDAVRAQVVLVAQALHALQQSGLRDGK